MASVRADSEDVRGERSSNAKDARCEVTSFDPAVVFRRWARLDTTPDESGIRSATLESRLRSNNWRRMRACSPAEIIGPPRGVGHVSNGTARGPKASSEAASSISTPAIRSVTRRQRSRHARLPRNDNTQPESSLGSATPSGQSAACCSADGPPDALRTASVVGPGPRSRPKFGPSRPESIPRVRNLIARSLEMPTTSPRDRCLLSASSIARRRSPRRCRRPHNSGIAATPAPVPN